MTKNDREPRGPMEPGPVAPPVVAQIEHWGLDRLHPLDRNPREHSDEQIDEIAESIQRFGFLVPVIVDEKRGRILAGNGRYAAAVKLGLSEIPVVGVGHLSEAEQLAFIIADNTIATHASWDEEILAEYFQEIERLGLDPAAMTFFSEEEVERILSEFTREHGEAEEDEVPEPPENPVSRTGDLWVLGEHRLVCGDSTNPEDVKRVLAGARPRLLTTDPPYGIELDLEWRDRAGHNELGPAEPSYMRRTEGHRNTTISGDTKADWSDAFELVPSLDTAYVWHASTYAIEVGLGLRRIGFELKQQIIWKKPHFALSRTNYHWQHEPCWYARKPGAAPFRGPHDQSTVWEAASPKMLMSARADGDDAVDHPTQKAIALFTRPIENHLGRGECVYEPFAGSGTCLIAAERTGRRCLAIEIDPKYVDVVVRRWELLTGRAATLDATGETFAQVAESRGVPCR